MKNCMQGLKHNLPGILACLAIAVPSWLAGRAVPVVGGAVFAILAGMVVTLLWTRKGGAERGIKWTSKYVLQAAVVLLGFGMDLAVIARTGAESLPIIACTITTALLVAWALHHALRIPSNISTLVGVGSSICGGSAIAATAPVIGADDDEVAQAISVIFFFNVLAAILFPLLGKAIGFSTTSGGPFGVFAGTAVNDTSSVTAAAATWDSMWGLGSQTLDKAVTVKLTRTLAIIPITLALALRRSKASAGDKDALVASTPAPAATPAGDKDAPAGQGFSLRRAFPLFVLFFLLASVATTVALAAGAPASLFQPVKELSKFLIVMAMAAIGLNSNVVKLVRSGGKPIVLGAACWVGITAVSLLMQHVMGIW
jgi:uncharacterized integral membrane protein (TIGR00698 family)